MKKLSFSFLILLLSAGVVFSQTEESPVVKMDEAVRALARDIHVKLTEKRAGRVSVGQFVFNDGITAFNSYWANQLIGEITNINGRTYIIATSGSHPVEWVITGEIVQAADIIRVYTRLIRSSDSAIDASFYSNFQLDGQITSMLAPRSGGTSSSSSSASAVDMHEPDSWERPVSYTIGANGQSAPVLNRALTDGDEDFFLLIPSASGRLTIETTGSIDTYMDFYEQENEDELDSNDDGGQGYNAKITQSVVAGRQYIAVVRGYDNSESGGYGFRAFITVREGAGSFENPISYEVGDGEENANAVQRNLQEGDEDIFLLIPQRSGYLIVETTGRLDTFLEFFDSDKEMLSEDDDGGNSTNARIRYLVTGGNRYYAMVRGYSSNVSGRYGFKAYMQGAGLARDEFEPDDESAQAKLIVIGTAQQRTFHTGDDVDWVRFQVTNPGRHIINVKGVNNNRLDTYIELFDSNLRTISEDDDGGDNLSSRLALNLSAGNYFLKIWCVDEPDQGYTVTVELQ